MALRDATPRPDTRLDGGVALKIRCEELLHAAYRDRIQINLQGCS
jgi:hypothetical protein